MYITLVTSVLCLATINFFDKGYFSPAKLLALIWIIISILFICINKYQISIFTDLLIALCISSFCMPFITINRVRFRSLLANNDVISKRILYIIIIFLIFYFPIYLNEIYLISEGSLLNFAVIRNAMTLQNSQDGLNPLISIGINLPIIFVIFISLYSPPKRIILYFIIYVISLIYILFSFSKGYILSAFIFCTSILALRKIISDRLIKILITTCFLIIIVMVAIRDDFVEKSLLFYMYFLSPIAALDLLVNKKFILNQPMNTLLIPLYELFGLDVHQGMHSFYTDLGEPTNVFTAFGLYLNDFGYIGSIIIYFIFGLISSFVYKILLTRNSPPKIYFFIYGWFIFGCSLSFFSDGFLGGSNTFIKYLLVILVFVNINNYFIAKK